MRSFRLSRLWQQICLVLICCTAISATTSWWLDEVQAQANELLELEKETVGRITLFRQRFDLCKISRMGYVPGEIALVDKFKQDLSVLDKHANAKYEGRSFTALINEIMSTSAPEASGRVNALKEAWDQLPAETDRLKYFLLEFKNTLNDEGGDSYLHMSRDQLGKVVYLIRKLHTAWPEQIKPFPEDCSY